MAKKEKRLERLRQHPKNVSFDDLKQVLEDYGFILRKVTGSHHTFKKQAEGKSWTITIPFRKPHVKSTYVKQVLAIIEEIEAAEGEKDEPDTSEE